LSDVAKAYQENIMIEHFSIQAVYYVHLSKMPPNEYSSEGVERLELYLESE
jgi:hypothetical protein